MNHHVTGKPYTSPEAQAALGTLQPLYKDVRRVIEWGNPHLTEARTHLVAYLALLDVAMQRGSSVPVNGDRVDVITEVYAKAQAYARTMAGRSPQDALGNVEVQLTDRTARSFPALVTSDTQLEGRL